MTRSRDTTTGQTGPTVAMLVETFPAASETFLVRQARALGAEVLAGVVHTQTVSGAESIPVRSLTGGQRFEGGTLRLLLGRLRRRLIGPPAPHWTARADRAWREYLAHERPDVVLAQYGPNALRCLAGCREAGVPLVAHFHGYDASGLLRQRAYRSALAGLFAGASAVVVVSKAMQDALVALGAPPQRTHRIPCGVPIDTFDVSACQDAQPCEFLAVGRFVDKKAPLLTLRAFAKCLADCPDATLTMLGGGPLLAAARRLAASREYAGRVELPGVQPIEEVRRHLARAGCFVQHSITAPNGDTEGWPVAIAEAAATGLPVIATRHAGIGEQVLQDQTGLLVDEGDWQAMADAMVALARDPQRRKQMGLAGRQHIEAVGSFENQARALGDVLRQAAQTSPPAAEAGHQNPS